MVPGSANMSSIAPDPQTTRDGTTASKPEGSKPPVNPSTSAAMGAKELFTSTDTANVSPGIRFRLIEPPYSAKAVFLYYRKKRERPDGAPALFVFTE